MAMEYRASVTTGEGIDFVLSDGSLDRHGTRINPRGWVLDKFRSNPIALFGHSGGFPIGRWESVRAEGDRLVGKLVMAAAGTSQRIDELRRLVEQGILRAVSVGFSVLEYGQPGKSDYDYIKQELLECSLVSVPSNTNALAKARALNVSPETLSLVFGESANERRGTVVNPGVSAANPPMNGRPTAMKTLAERITDAQASLNAKRDRLTELQGAESRDLDAIEKAMDAVEFAQRELGLLEREEKIEAGAVARGSSVAAPHIARQPLGYRQKQVGGFDLLVRGVVVRGISYFTQKSVERVLDERYPGHEDTAKLMQRADQTIGTTTGSHWADDLVQSVNQGFLDALTGFSVYPALRANGVALNFDGNGTVTIPRRTGGTAGGGFVAEGSPIRVGKLTTAGASLTPNKMGVIVAFSDELALRATPAIEALVRRAILEDTGATLDSVLLDATAGSTTRPAGLLYGVSAAASGYGGGDHIAVKNDFQTLLQPFITANAASGITVIMNPAQALAISLMDGPDNNAGWFSAIRQRVNIIESTYATANRLIAVRNPDFVTAMGDGPRFDISQQATIHMEDTTPLEIVSASPTTADPVRSLWQTASTGVRMIMNVGWTMGRTGVVQWIDGTTY